MGIGSVSSGISQQLQLTQLDQRLSSQVSERAQLQQQKAEAALGYIMNTKIEAQQQAVKSADIALKGSRINVYA